MGGWHIGKCDEVTQAPPFPPPALSHLPLLTITCPSIFGPVWREGVLCPLCLSPTLLLKAAFFLLVCITEMIKDKNKPVVPARSRGPWSRKGRPREAEEMAAPKLKASSLQSCRGFLRSTLTQWGPVFPHSELMQEPTNQAPPESDASGPVEAAAALVVRWLLASVTGHPLSETEATGLLSWLHSHILPHPVVVADLLRDSGVRSGLFKLYSQLCGAEGLMGPTLSAACLFNTVMLQLLEARGAVESPARLAVKALCHAALQEEDEATRGKTGFLVGVGLRVGNNFSSLEPPVPP